MFRSEIGSGFEDPGGTPPPRIPRSTPPGTRYDMLGLGQGTGESNGVLGIVNRNK